MRSRSTLLALLLAFLLLAAGSAADEPVGTADEPVGIHLQKISVNICCPSGRSGYGSVQGSGTIIAAATADGPASWILTAHHVVEDLREVKTVIDSKGDEKKSIQYRDAQVIQEEVQDGRSVGELKFDAKVISVDARRDVALLRVRKDDFAKVGVKFYLTDQIPQPGTEIYHCGAPGGKEIGGTCSLTAGIISRLGVRIPEFGGAQHGVFDQTDTAALGGSSGGLIALKADGRYIGMITLGLRGGDNFHWTVPIRSIRDWTKEIKAEWLLDPALPRPTKEQIKAIPLELAAPGFAAADKPTPAPVDTPSPLIFRQ